MRSNFALSEFQDEDLKLTSFDLVRLACNLPYMDEERARKMEFSTEYIARERNNLYKNEPRMPDVLSSD